MKKIIDDTLKNKDGTWSKQSLTFFLSFSISVFLGINLTAVSFYMNITVNPIAENVFNSFMMLTGVMSGTNIWNKIVENKKEADDTAGGN